MTVCQTNTVAVTTTTMMPPISHQLIGPAGGVGIGVGVGVGVGVGGGAAGLTTSEPNNWLTLTL